MQICGIKIFHTMFAISKVVTLDEFSLKGTVISLNN